MIPKKRGNVYELEFHAEIITKTKDKYLPEEFDLLFEYTSKHLLRKTYNNHLGRLQNSLKWVLVNSGNESTPETQLVFLFTGNIKEISKDDFLFNNKTLERVNYTRNSTTTVVTLKASPLNSFELRFNQFDFPLQVIF